MATYTCSTTDYQSFLVVARNRKTAKELAAKLVVTCGWLSGKVANVSFFGNKNFKF